MRLHKTFQFGNTNLVATVWQVNNKAVSVLSTTCAPNTVFQANCQVVQFNQLENVFMYNKSMNAVDHNDQLHMQYETGHLSKKAWKYLMWFFFYTSTVNAFILWTERSTRVTSKWRYIHINFQIEVACSLIAGFS